MSTSPEANLPFPREKRPRDEVLSKRPRVFFSSAESALSCDFAALGGLCKQRSNQGLAEVLSLKLSEVMMRSRKSQAEPLKPGDEASPGTPGTGEDICPKCSGSGKIGNHQCPNCQGTGKITKGIGGG
jgi:hypothetical protein